MALFPEQQNSTTWEEDNFDHFTEVMTGNGTLLRESVDIQRNIEEIPVDTSFIPLHIKSYLGFDEIYLTYLGNSQICIRITFDKSERVEKFRIQAGEIIQMEIPVIEEAVMRVSKIMLFRIQDVFDDLVLIGPFEQEEI